MANLRADRLFRGDLVAVTDVRCRGAGMVCGTEEQAGTHQVVFTRSGLFVKHTGRRQIVGQPNQAIFFNRDECYRVSHPAAIGDDCTVFVFATEIIVQVLQISGRPPPTRSEAPFEVPQVRVDPKVLWRFQNLRRTLRAGRATALEVEENALEILASLLRAAGPATAMGGHGPARVIVQRRRELAEAVQVALAARPGAAHSLAALAHSVDCSPFHLARVFREEVGLPVHRYLVRLRLALALERLMDGEPNLSALACDLGFTSHSHLTSLFRRTFATTPSRFRGNDLSEGRPPP